MTVEEKYQKEICTVFSKDNSNLNIRNLCAEYSIFLF